MIFHPFIMRSLCLLALLMTLTQSAAAQGTGGSEADQNVKISPLPDPPSIETLTKKSDMILKAELIGTRTYRLAGKTIGQCRFRAQKSVSASRFYTVRPGDEFTVTFQMKPDELGPYFSESPEHGSYVVFLMVRNVQLGGKIVGYIPEFLFPNPFSLYDVTTPGILKKIGEAP